MNEYEVTISLVIRESTYHKAVQKAMELVSDLQVRNYEDIQYKDVQLDDVSKKEDEF